MTKPDINNLVPVEKNGKFLGYADARQLKRNKSIKPYDKAKAAAKIALQEQKKAEEDLKKEELIAARDKKAEEDLKKEELIAARDKNAKAPPAKK